ncbi:gag-pol polyprotein [Trichonephila clavipes]|nr:gag-pol polyprotein [Trichonephila clavipes]
MQCSANHGLSQLGQIQELSLQVAELTRERNSSHQRYVLTAGDHIHALEGVSIEEVASATIIAVIKSRSGKCVSPCAFLQKTTYGMVRKELNLGLRRPLSGTFIIADVSSPIIGADFLKHFNLLIDLKKKKHHMAQSTILLLLAHQSLPRLEGYTKLYDAVKVEFEFLLAQGIIRPSKSPWSSPLPVVPKSDSTVRPVGDYRQLNSVTEFDSYPMPYLNDFAHALHGKRIFSKIDIFKAFHQIPIAECEIPKTAVTTPWGKKDSKPLNWSSEAITAFQRCKQALADAALLAHPSPSAPLALHVDASDYAIGGALHQVLDSELQPLAFFSRKLTSSEKSYSAYDRKSDKCSPRQIRQLDFISQFTTNIVHIPGSDNIAADVLSRVSAFNFPSQIDYDCIAETQQTDQELHTLIASGTSLELKKVTFPNLSTEIMCDLSTGTDRPYSPKQHRQDVFSDMHNLSHPGIRRSVHLMKQRFVWPSISSDVAKWARHCLACQKIQNSSSY